MPWQQEATRRSLPTDPFRRPWEVRTSGNLKQLWYLGHKYSGEVRNRFVRNSTFQTATSGAGLKRLPARSLSSKKPESAL